MIKMTDSKNHTLSTIDKIKTIQISYILFNNPHDIRQLNVYHNDNIAVSGKCIKSFYLKYSIVP